jgi:glycosyltransferase involved in cell wall biosynthesis
LSKIILIHPQAGIDWKSNSSVFAVELARRLDNYFEVELLSGAECGSFSRPINSLPRGGSRLANSLVSTLVKRWFQQPKMAIDQLSSFLPCISYLLNHPADVILPQNGYAGLLAAACVRGIKQTPILFTDHNSLLNQEKNLERNLTLKPDRLIALNPIVAEYAQKLAPNQIVETIPWGIDPTEFTPEGKVMTTGLSQPCIIAVAPLNRHSDQRIKLTIEAVARIPEASLLICGEGADLNYFQALGDRLLGSERFQIRTFAYAQMPQVYRSGNVFTSAVTQEPCGLKYIEAMACGLPVVATDNAVHRYLIGEGGITCDVTNVDAYSSALQSAIAKHWYQQQPRQNALRFSWQGITLLYYQAILKTMTTYNHQFISAKPRQSINQL